MVKYKINHIYKAQLTVKNKPPYVGGATFIGRSNKTFVFEKQGEEYTEVFTGASFNEAVEDISQAHKEGVLINPTLVSDSAFKKLSRKNGEATEIDMIPVYHGLNNKVNNREKKLIKVRPAA